jgi:hypothetical protein
MRTRDVTPEFSIHIEAVHRLRGFGAVATYTVGPRQRASAPSGE